MIALSYKRFTLRQLVATTMTVSLVSLLVLFPLNILYWRWIGHI